MQVNSAKRGKQPDPAEPLDTDWQDKSPAERHCAMTWMQRQEPVFNINIEVYDFTAMTNLIRTIWAGPTAKIAI